MSRGVKFMLNDTLKERAPLLINAAERPLPSSWNYALTTLEADLLEVRATDSKSILTCSSNGHVFEVSADFTNDRIKNIQPGSRLNLTGICQLRSSDPASFYRKPDGLSLFLRGTEDLSILKSPPWWTLERILVGLGLLLACAVGALIWVGLLRKRVKAQTEIIGNQIELEVTTRERQRLARDLHDSLEQGMGSLALQLASAQRYRDLGKDEKLETSLELAQKTLAYCQKESRESIYDLRRGKRGGSSLEWQDEILLNELESNDVELKHSILGESTPIEPRIEVHIVKVIREASTNAIRHGNASVIEVTHHYENDGLTVRIQDDGSGFDPKAELPRGHFGIIGMRERAKRINGTLEITSKPGDGTLIILKVPNLQSMS